LNFVCSPFFILITAPLFVRRPGATLTKITLTRRFLP
jgi:hypothetical protein